MFKKFADQAEYSQFRAWKLEGSCLAQRMSLSAPGGRFEIPAHWTEYAKLDREWPAKMPDFY